MYYPHVYMDDIRNYKFKKHKCNRNERKLNNQINKEPKLDIIHTGRRGRPMGLRTGRAAAWSCG